MLDASSMRKRVATCPRIYHQVIPRKRGRARSTDLLHWLRAVVADLALVDTNADARQ